mgnify:CR=1 FL=1
MQFSLPFIDIIIFAVIAIYLIYRLKNILGQNTGFDQKSESENLDNKKFNNVIKLKNLNASKDKSIHEKRIKTIDETFSEDEFINGAKVFFKMVIENFVKGNLSSISKYISKDLLKSFEKAIKDRNNDNEILIIDLLNIKSISIQNVEISNKKVKISVLFETEQIKALKDQNNKIIDGNLKTSITVRDIWGFEKDIKSTDVNWTLVETGTA